MSVRSGFSSLRRVFQYSGPSTQTAALPVPGGNRPVLAILPTGASQNRWKITVNAVFASTCTWLC